MYKLYLQIWLVAKVLRAVQTLEIQPVRLSKQSVLQCEEELRNMLGFNKRWLCSFLFDVSTSNSRREEFGTLVNRACSAVLLAKFCQHSFSMDF